MEKVDGHLMFSWSHFFSNWMFSCDGIKSRQPSKETIFFLCISWIRSPSQCAGAPDLFFMGLACDYRILHVPGLVVVKKTCMAACRILAVKKDEANKQDPIIPIWPIWAYPMSLGMPYSFSTASGTEECL